MKRWLLAAVVVILLLALPTLTYPLGRDQGEFATIGRGILSGQAPYTQLWNPKPPAVFYVYAAAMTLFGQTSPALRFIDLLIFPGIAWALFDIGRRRHARVGVWAVLLFGGFYFRETFWTLTQNDGIVLLPMTLAYAFALRAADAGPKSALWAGAAGLLAGWVFWFKYPFALFALALAAAYLLARGRQQLDGRTIGAFILGGLVGGLSIAAVLLSQGAFDALLESIRVTSAYTALGFNLQDLTAALVLYLGFRWAIWGVLMLLPFVWPLAWRDAAFRSLRIGWLIWLLAGTAIMLVQAKAYDYHWLPMLPALALIGGDTLEALAARLSQRTALLARGVVVAGLLGTLALAIWPRALPYLTGQIDQTAYEAQFQAGEFIADESLQVAQYLRERTTPGDSLYIWGFRPEIYYRSGLNPATRFIFQFPLVASWYPPEWRDENVATLWAALPPYVLVLQADYMPWVTGSHDDSNTLLQAYTELNNWLIFNYDREIQIGNVFVWRRKPAPT